MIRLILFSRPEALQKVVHAGVRWRFAGEDLFLLRGLFPLFVQPLPFPLQRQVDADQKKDQRNDRGDGEGFHGEQGITRPAACESA